MCPRKTQENANTTLSKKYSYLSYQKYSYRTFVPICAFRVLCGQDAHFITARLPWASAYTSGERLREASGLRIDTFA